MSANPAYGEVAGIVLHENTAYSIAQTTSVAEYENIDRKTMHSKPLIFVSVWVTIVYLQVELVVYHRVKYQ